MRCTYYLREELTRFLIDANVINVDCLACLGYSGWMSQPASHRALQSRKKLSKQHDTWDAEGKSHGKNKHILKLAHKFQHWRKLRLQANYKKLVNWRLHEPEHGRPIAMNSQHHTMTQIWQLHPTRCKTFSVAAKLGGSSASWFALN